MLYLLLAILSSALIAVIMRLSSGKVRANLSMLAANYLVCLLLAAICGNFMVFPKDQPGFSMTVLMGMGNGALYLLGFVLLQYNTRKNGIVLSSVFMKLGLLVPMVLSVLVFRESPTWMQIVGFVLALAAILLLNLKKQTVAGQKRWTLLVMLLMCGGADAMSKVFEVLGPAVLSEQFLFYTFAMALVLCGGLVICQKERPGLRELLFGIAIGVPNFFASKFLLLSLKNLPAVVVFPSFSIGTMLLATLAGVVFYKERLSKLQWAALTTIVAALLLLNI
jgi:drug/metabolite transporter (DMT)-like permease